MNASSAWLAAALLVCPLISNVAGSQRVYSHGSPANHEQFMLELINRARANPRAEATRQGIGLNDGLAGNAITVARKQPLAFNRRLNAAARDHSRWMLASGIFSHTGWGGSSPSQRAAARGYRLGAAENIAQGSSTAPRNSKTQAAQAHAGLFQSPGHRTNLLNADHNVVGLGMVFGRRGDWHVNRTTQSFSAGATAESGPFIVGAAYDDRNGNRFYDPGEGLGGIEVRPHRGPFYAVTSSSGGFAIPIRPVRTRAGTVRVDLPFPVSVAGSWERAQAYDRRFRAAQIRNAPEMTLRLSWSGKRGGLPLRSEVKIKRPELINYRLTGSDGIYFERSMITSVSVKVDLVFTRGQPRVIVR